MNNSGCERCELLPRELPEHLNLYYSAPRDATEQKLGDLCAKRGFTRISGAADEVWAFSGSREQLRALCASADDALTPVEKESTRVLVVAHGTQVGIRELVHMETFSSLTARVEGGRIIALLRDRRLTTWFQPIISLGDGVAEDGTYSVFAYECLARGFDPEGNIVSPGEMFSVARQADLLFYLDRAARLSAIEQAAAFNIPNTIFINFNPSAIYSPENCLATTFEAIQEYGLSREGIVFEIVESDSVAEMGRLRRILDFYRREGFRVALDDMGAGFNSLVSLNDLRPDFVKVDTELTRDVDTDSFKARIAGNILDLSNQLDIPSVVEGIETEGEYRWVRDHGATYAQGFFFARPASTPAIPAYDTGS